MRQENSYWKVEKVLEDRKMLGDRKMLEDQNTLARAVGPVAPESVVSKVAPETSSACPEPAGGLQCEEDPIPVSSALGGHGAPGTPTQTDEEHASVPSASVEAMDSSVVDCPPQLEETVPVKADIPKEEDVPAPVPATTDEPPEGQVQVPIPVAIEAETTSSVSSDIEDALEKEMVVDMPAGDDGDKVVGDLDELDEEPPLTTRQEQWSQKPKPARRGRGRGRGQGRGKKASQNDGVESVLDSDEEINSSKVPKGRAKVNATAKRTPKAKAKSKGKAVKSSAETGGSRVESEEVEKEKKEIPIVWGPLFKHKVSHLFSSASDPSVTTFDPQEPSEDMFPAVDLPAGPAKRLKRKCQAEPVAPSSPCSPSQEVKDEREAEDPVLSEPCSKRPRAKRGEAVSFARRNCPKTKLPKNRWIAIRDAFQLVVRHFVLCYGFRMAEFEAARRQVQQYCLLPITFKRFLRCALL